MASTAILISFLLFIFICRIDERVAQSEVRTSLGKIIGTSFTTRYGRNISAFLQIPYAQSPVGNLRFKNPLPASPWKGTFIADKIALPCPQINDDGEILGVEDCLFLNVYTPRINTSNLLPTMVYIHGGRFQIGDAQPSDLGPEFILDKDVVLVTMQYRLGVLGFISTGDTVAPGNFGLKDQVLALQWVQENIANFGGDPKSVTLFGQSAGSVSVNFHVISPITKGLFHRYIAQSGSALCPWGFSDSNEYKNYAFELGKQFNCSTNSSEDLINCLRKIDAYDLIINSNVFSGVQQLTGVTWIPTDEPDIPGAFLTMHPIESILQNKILDLPNISGVVKNEGLVITAKLHANETLFNYIAKDINKFLSFLTSSITTGDAEKMANKLKNFYFSDIDINNKTQMLIKLTDLFGDVSFLFPEILQLQLVNERIKSPCYFYSFEYRGKYSKTSSILNSNIDIGITHADDLIYLFPSTPYLFNISTPVELSQSDNHMIDILIDLWTSFASTGVPTTNFNDDPYVWKPYSDENYYLQISGDSQNNISLSKQSHLLEHRMHFWAILLIKSLL
ncbi:hypothetical protein PV327_005793 [Microctonus hyperodae]|uniref:Carboxylic ester hydrolase n=1 Tax=Microctonus hyperodae TaxID=165561 RepID=A0AA39G244_MICHY|nr:hypothetical protein PV327_005793 [Microctonus hyperodae]